MNERLTAITKNQAMHQRSALFVGVFLSILTVLIVVGLSAERVAGITLQQESRNVGAFVSGMFGFAAIESFRKAL